MQENENEYRAFVSYSHADTVWAQWLHKKIETYRLPKAVAGGSARRRVGRLFLDRSELATSSSLSTRIQEAMDRSANLLLICSPSSRRSRWVNEEVRRFREAGKEDRIFCLIVDGDPASTGDDACFPDALLEPSKPGKPRLEPLAADVRPGKDRRNDAKLKLIAGLLDLPFDALKRRELARRQRLLFITMIVSVSLLLIMTALAVAAIISRREAVRQRDTAERTVTFLQDLFDEARPERTGGAEISVRTMVDRASRAATTSAELKSEPEVRAELLTTLADVFAKLRLPASGGTLIREAYRFPISDDRIYLHRASVDANLALLSSNYKRMNQVLDGAFATIGRDRALKQEFMIRLLMLRAQLRQQTNQPDAAEQDYLAARQAALTAKPPQRVIAATALLAAATGDVDSGMVDRAESRLIRVIEERRGLGQPFDPDVLTAYNSLGAIAIKRGKPDAAEQWFRRAIELQSHVLGAESLDVALSRSNLGRALVEQRRFAEARSALLQAKAVYLKEVGESADVFANLEDSLGLAFTGLGDAKSAKVAFSHGLLVAKQNEMPKQIELYTDLAELSCGTGTATDGLDYVKAARARLAEFALPEPWRAARIDSVEARCLLTIGKADEANVLAQRSTPQIIERWGRGSLFGTSAIRISQQALRPH